MRPEEKVIYVIDSLGGNASPKPINWIWWGNIFTCWSLPARTTHRYYLCSESLQKTGRTLSMEEWKYSDSEVSFVHTKYMQILCVTFSGFTIAKTREYIRLWNIRLHGKVTHQSTPTDNNHLKCRWPSAWCSIGSWVIPRLTLQSQFYTILRCCQMWQNQASSESIRSGIAKELMAYMHVGGESMQTHISPRKGNITQKNSTCSYIIITQNGIWRPAVYRL